MPNSSRRLTRSVVGVTSSALLGLLVSAMPAAGRPAADSSWEPVQSIEPGGSIRGPRSIVTRDGTSILTWYKVGIHGDCSNRFTRVRPAGEAVWSPATVVKADARDPLATVTRAGNKVALVSSTCDGGISVRRMRDGSWGPRTRVDDEGDFAFGLASAMDTAGDVLAEWETYDGSDATMHTAVAQVGSRKWTVLPSVVLPDDRDRPVHVSLDDTGRVTVVLDGGDGAEARVATLTDGTWTIRDLGNRPYRHAVYVDAASRPNGLLCIILADVIGPPAGPSRIVAYVRDPGEDGVGAPVLLSDTGNEEPIVSATTSGLGDVIVGWSEGQEGGRFHGIVTLQRRTADGQWSDRTALGLNTGFYGPNFSRHDDGTLVVDIDNVLHDCTATLTCTTLDPPAGIGTVNQLYTAGPGRSIVAVGADPFHNGPKYKDLRASYHPPPGLPG